jgi:hypothetical protein
MEHAQGGNMDEVRNDGQRMEHGYFSWSSGFVPRQESTIWDEARRNPNAVFERAMRLGDVELAQEIINRFTV